MLVVLGVASLPQDMAIKISPDKMIKVHVLLIILVECFCKLEINLIVYNSLFIKVSYTYELKAR